MVFSSLLFLFIFLPFVLAIYYVLPKRFRNGFLLIADLVFYGWGEPLLISLMLVSIVINYIAGLLIQKFDGDLKKKKAILVASVIIDLGMLGFFKYAGFFTRNINSLIPSLGIKELNIPLPIGISFYTFQIMSYTIDVFRGDTAAQKNIVSFGAYVSLFPQLIAGPIVRYRDVDDQLVTRHENFEQFYSGVKRFMVGLVKKVLLANPLGLLWDTLRDMPQSSVLASWVGILAFTLQIYFDFSGYSDMAIGLGRMLGFEFLENFDYPYISKSITEFWRRWHISLGTWFKEYVYIPLGGNRKGQGRTILNLLIVWMLTGFWHGASWNFLFWGLYFGVILILEKLFLLKALKKAPAFLSHAYSLILIVFGWVIFYFSDDVGGASAMFEFIPGLFSGELTTPDSVIAVVRALPVLVAGGVCSTPVIKKLYDKLKGKKGIFVAEAAAVVVLLIICTASLVSDSYNPFLYFKF